MHKNTKRWPILLLGMGFLGGFVCMLALMAGSALLPWNQADQPPGGNGPKIGALAPDFELANLGGENVRLSALRGKPILLNFWATWCGPCTEEMPLFQYYTQQIPNLQVVAVNANEAQDAVKAYADKWGLTFNILLDPGEEVNGVYHVFALPTTYFLDAEGQVQAIHTGSLSDGQIKKYLQQIGALE